ncbi:Aspartic proteinase-like protein 1 [Sesamum alatum]|uniref:Aspartic proteinase-like protein 1 n=1 Tax=Sesamum alatum TaxID=300844 RepID=A0AAE1XN28_9LAMI|nr:Aspartic proteinase-like protein 1 [Sesamum alatum]
MTYTHRLAVVLSVTFHVLIVTGAIIPKRSTLTLSLIHRDSIASLPIYKPKLGFSDHVINSSRARLDNYSSTKMIRTSVPLDDIINAPVVPMEDGSIFLVNISIGEPPVPQLLAMDTGSPLIWVHCTRCEGCNNVFDPQQSSTYTQLSSNSPECSKFVSGHQDQESQCLYGIRYDDASTSRGVLAMEKFTFATSTGGTVEMPDIVFGCALDSNGSVGDFNGILGLEAPERDYFAARTGNKFSYCIGNISDRWYTYNRLILGDGSIIQGDSTPLQTIDRHYVVTLEGISLGGKQLAICDQVEFHFNVTIDSGTTYTQLVKSAYDPLMTEVKNLLNGVLKPARVRNGENQLCYLGDLERDLKGFPLVTLHLAEGTNVDLDVEALFQRSTDGSAFCMAVVESRENMIGVRAQQYYNVGFDLDAKRVSFQRIDCELLED